MHPFEDHIRAFHKACGEELKTLTPVIVPSGQSSFDEGVYESLAGTLHTLSRNLENALRGKSTSVPFNEFANPVHFLAALAGQSLIRTELVPPAWDKMEQEIFGKEWPQIEFDVPADRIDFDFTAYQEGLDEGDKRALEIIFPKILATYQQFMPSPAPH